MLYGIDEEAYRIGGGRCEGRGGKGVSSEVSDQVVTPGTPFVNCSAQLLLLL